MRKAQFYRMDPADAVALLARAPFVHLASTAADGSPVLRTLHAVVDDGAVWFHGAPVGEKMECVGHAAVVSAEEVVAQIPSYFVDPELACPATSYFRGVQAHGTITSTGDLVVKARVMTALMRKHQPEGGHRPIDPEDPGYANMLRALAVLRVGLERVDGKAKLGQNRTPEARGRVLEHLWRRGAPGDPEAIEAVRAASPVDPVPPFLTGPAGTTLHGALRPGFDAQAAQLLEGLYWLAQDTAEQRAAAQRGATAWCGATLDGVLVASGRALSDGVRQAWLYDVVVREDLRGRGLGEAVVRLLLDHPRVRGARVVTLGTRDAQSLYARLGFAPVAELAAPYGTITQMRLVR